MLVQILNGFYKVREIDCSASNLLCLFFSLIVCLGKLCHFIFSLFFNVKYVVCKISSMFAVEIQKKMLKQKCFHDIFFNSWFFFLYFFLLYIKADFYNETKIISKYFSENLSK